jgi:hypothetical protein
MRTLSWRPCATTVATTLAPDKKGAPIGQVGATSDRKNLVERQLLADFSVQLLDLDFLTVATRYCLPPVLMTAYI